jgi:hypothetical protein
MLRVAARAGGGVGSGSDFLSEAAERFATFGVGAVRTGGGGGADGRCGGGVNGRCGGGVDGRCAGGTDERTSVVDLPGPEGGHSEDGRSDASLAVPSVTALPTWITLPHLRHFIRTERPATFSSAI